jgi:hypothetical protein
LAEPLEEGDRLSEQLADADLLILAPALDGAYRRMLLATTKNAEAVLKVPVITLINAMDEEDKLNLGYWVHWPCRIKELVHQIEKALLAGPTSDGA